MIIRNYKREYETAQKLLDAAVIEAACKKVENDRLKAKVTELEEIIAQQGEDLRAVRNTVSVARMALSRAK